MEYKCNKIQREIQRDRGKQDRKHRRGERTGRTSRTGKVRKARKARKAGRTEIRVQRQGRGKKQG